MFGKQPLSQRGRWLVIMLATVALQFSYWSFVASAAAGAMEDGPDTGGLLALALGLAPFVFMILAFGSRHPNAPIAVLKAMGLFLVFGAPLGLANVVVGVAAAYGAGGVAALRREPDVHSLRWRVVAVAAMTVYLVLLLAVPEFQVISGAVLPFMVIGIADTVHETRQAETAGNR